jgi:hypothetical protein
MPTKSCFSGLLLKQEKWRTLISQDRNAAKPVMQIIFQKDRQENVAVSALSVCMHASASRPAKT